MCVSTQCLLSHREQAWELPLDNPRTGLPVWLKDSGILDGYPGRSLIWYQDVAWSPGSICVGQNRSLVWSSHWDAGLGLLMRAGLRPSMLMAAWGAAGLTSGPTACWTKEGKVLAKAQARNLAILLPAPPVEMGLYRPGLWVQIKGRVTKRTVGSSEPRILSSLKGRNLNNGKERV